jgi:hypothetical protein
VFTDRSARNGTRYHYVVVARDAAGNASDPSNEVEALPVLTIADARLEGPAELSQPLSAVDPGTPIRARVRVEGTTAAAGPTIGILAQLGFGKVRGGDPTSDYRWSTMTFDSDVDGADRLVGTVRPDELGGWNVVLRASTDGGRTWVYADRGGILREPLGYRPDLAVSLGATAAADTTAPPAPSGLAVKVVTDASLTLGWNAVSAPDLFRYEVYRGTTAGGPYERVGTATDPAFTDDTVGQGDQYVYVVAAVDTSFNRSDRSLEIAAAAETREVAVTFTVRLPANTSPGDTVFIAGDFQGWNPGGTPMTQLDPTTWSITVPFTEGDPPQYKYTRGTWDAVEKDAACGEIANRTFDVAYGADGTQQVQDTVEKWRDVDQCG